MESTNQTQLPAVARVHCDVFQAGLPIGDNRPAIVREIPHFGIFPAFPHFCENVPNVWLYFEITKIAENRNNVSSMKIFSSKKLCENVNDSVTQLLKLLFYSKIAENRNSFHCRRHFGQKKALRKRH